MRPEKQLKYGRWERERRYLLAAPPDLAYDRECDIVDRYLVGTRLRLRRVSWADGAVEYKLARKLPPVSPGQGVLGNLYLSPFEHDLLAVLPAKELRKRRRYFADWAIDSFETGMVTAEIELDDPIALSHVKPPFGVIREVTSDPAYTGAALAGLPAS